MCVSPARCEKSCFICLPPPCESSSQISGWDSAHTYISPFCVCESMCD
jgi:hypothetical protein